MILRSNVILSALGILLASIVIAMLLALSGQRAKAVEPTGQEIGGPSCRWGVSAHGVDQVEWIDDVGAGWYVFFGGYPDAPGNDVQIAPVISVKQDKDGSEYLDTYTISPNLDSLKPLLATYPSTLWIVGNEVDRGPGPGQTIGQGDTFPDVYARAYNEVYYFIKQHDPTALVANSGLVQVTPGRLQYLDLMWQSYRGQFGEPMPVDVWNMHIYVLPEAELDGTPNGIASVALGTDPALAIRGPGRDGSQCDQEEIYCFAEHDNVDIFEDQARAMRRWMFEHGQRQKPLILSEFSILYPCDDPEGLNCEFLLDEFGNDFDKQRVQNYLVETVARLENATDSRTGDPLDGGHLVQQWAWFSISTTTQVGDVSDLVKRDGTGGPLIGLTELGHEYQQLASSSTSYVNLIPAPVDGVIAESPGAGGQLDVTLSAEAANNGTLTYGGAITVTFYSDGGLTEVIDQVQVPGPGPGGTGLRGCALETIPVSATWPDLTSGLHRFWVEVEGGGASGEPDKVAAGFVLVDPEKVWLPVISR